MCRDASRSIRRGGLTLVEICLVLALLIIIGSIAAPVLSGSFEQRRLSSGADLLRAAWSRARLAAMKSGETYFVRLEPHGSRFQIVSLEQAALPETQQLPADDPDKQHPPSDFLRVGHNRLPDGVVFANANIANSNQVTAIMGSMEGGPWSSPIVFRSDGTCSDASILLASEHGRTIRVTLRGITGTSAASDFGREAVE
jgi:type II secretory pathway pseudopilin PulG